MFDIGFFELLMIAVIALLVLGPERLPHAVRMTGAWIGKFRRAATSVREEIEREVNAYEMQQRINEQLEKSGISESKEMLEKTKQTLRNGILDEETLKEIEKRGLGDYAKDLIAAPEETTDHEQSADEQNSRNLSGSETDSPAKHTSDKPATDKIPPAPAAKNTSESPQAPPAKTPETSHPSTGDSGDNRSTH